MDGEMKKLSEQFNNDVLEIIKDWLGLVNKYVKLKEKSQVECKYYCGSVYFAVPVHDTESELERNYLRTISGTEFICEDGENFVALRHNDILADMYDEYMKIKEVFYG